LKFLKGQKFTTYPGKGSNHQWEKLQWRKNFESAKSTIKEKEDLIDIGSTLHASNI